MGLKSLKCCFLDTLCQEDVSIFRSCTVFFSPFVAVEEVEFDNKETIEKEEHFGILIVCKLIYNH